MKDVNRITYNGIDLRDYGLYVSGDKTFNSPKKEYTRVSIPGRSGDLFLFDGRYENVEVTYSSILIKDYEKNAAAIRSILLSPNGYVRLEDSYHPDEYRMATFIGPLEFDSVYLQAGVADLEFDCQPERWLKSGEEEIDVPAASETIIPNNTSFPAYPLLIATCNGWRTITVDGVSFRINGESEEGDSTFYIDCKTMDCYEIQNGEKNSRNDRITIDDFPFIKPGGSIIRITDNATLKVIPRWYIL